MQSIIDHSDEGRETISEESEDHDSEVETPTFEGNEPGSDKEEYSISRDEESLTSNDSKWDSTGESDSEM